MRVVNAAIGGNGEVGRRFLGEGLREIALHRRVQPTGQCANTGHSGHDGLGHPIDGDGIARQDRASGQAHRGQDQKEAHCRVNLE
jgi:hypothetical protein